MAEHLARRLKDRATAPARQRPGQGDWVLVDAGDVIVHSLPPRSARLYDWKACGRGSKNSALLLMRLWIYAIGHMRGTPEGQLCGFLRPARKMGRNMVSPPVALEELPVSKHRDTACA